MYAVHVRASTQRSDEDGGYPPRMGTAATRNRRGEGERLRGALLDAAVGLLDETGEPERLSVRAVTTRAGVSPTALYLHFADRDALLAAVCVRCFGALDEALAGVGAAAPRERLPALGLAYLAFARERPGPYALLFSARVRAPEDAEREGVGLGVYGVLVEALRDCGLASGDAFEVGTVLWTALHGRASLPADPLPGFPSDERFVALLTEAALRGR